jgi:hypothetical protein
LKKIEKMSEPEDTRIDCETKLISSRDIVYFQESVPHQPENATEANSDEANFEFTKLECLLFAFHTFAQQSPEYLTENASLHTDFKVSRNARN